MVNVNGTNRLNVQINHDQDQTREKRANDKPISEVPHSTTQVYTSSQLGKNPSVESLRKQAELQEIRRDHIGVHLQNLLGDINPLDGAVNAEQREKMKASMKALQVKVDLAVVDQHGNLTPMDQRVFNEAYKPNFPDHEAVPQATILASLQSAKGQELDGKRFTMCYTGILPGEKDRKPLAFAQGGTLDAGGRKCANYAEYWTVEDKFRGQKMLYTMMGFNSAVSMAYAKKEGKEFVGTVWEMEHKRNGADAKSRAYSEVRAEIYTKTGASILVGRDASGKARSHHVQPDITEKGDSGLVALHIAFRAHPTNGEASVTPEMLAKLADSYDDYFNHWAKTNSDRGSESGINAEKVDEGRQHKAKLRGAFEIVGMVPPNESPTEMDFARDVPEIARAVAENFNILGFENLDYNDPSVRNAVANAANFTFEYEKVWAEKFDLSKDDVHNWSSGFSSTFFQMEMADKKSSPSVAMSTQPTSS